MAILRIFPVEFEDKIWSGAFPFWSGHPYKFQNLNKDIGFGRMWTLPGPLSEKLNFKFLVNLKMDFSGSQKREKLHFNTEFHIFGSTWESNNFKTCF